MTTVRPYTPTREDPRALDRRTVGGDADALIERIVARIAASADGDLSHTLVIGPRGSGKTHLLAVARHRAQQRSGATHRSVVIPEDGHGLVTYTELLQQVLADLGGPPSPRDLDVGLTERSIADALDGRILVLFIENLDRLFRQIGAGGQHDLRAWVEGSRQVLLVASAPLFFDDVGDRDKPWFGSFAPESITELTAEDGALLLANLRPDDHELAEFLATPSGQARVTALHHLTGGSPRLWTILADVITVERLDELVPVVERLLEELVTYYQQRLWDLGPNEERVIVSLARGEVAQTATQLADRLGLDKNLVGTTLGRLADARWVRGEKVPGTDQRTTWYSLREPLLRHYLQYRTDVSPELTLIVEMLRWWFDPLEREHLLIQVPGASQAERYLGAALNLDRPAAYDDGYTDKTPQRLLLQARRWITDPAAPDGFADAGRMLEALLARRGFQEAERVDLSRAQVDALSQVELGDSIADDLHQLADAATGPEALVLGWIAAVWLINVDDARARRELEELVPELAHHELLRLHVDHELAFILGLSDPAAAIMALNEVIAARSALQGENHPDCLRAKSNRISFVAEGDPQMARSEARDLSNQIIGVWGPHDARALTARGQVVRLTGLCGDPQAALDLAAELLPERARHLGPHHPDTLTTRYQIAYYTGQTGEPHTALDLYTQLLPDQNRHLGPHHPNTLTTRHQIAYLTGQTGDPHTALDLYAQLLPDQTRHLGPNHPDTLITRHGITFHMGWLGDDAGAAARASAVLDDLPLAVSRVPDGLEAASRWVLSRSVLRLAKAGRLDDVPPEARTGTLGAVLDAVVSPAARAQLPRELRVISDALTKRAGVGTGQSGPSES